MSEEGELVRTIDTYYHDIDINGHVNSVKYIEHVLDLWPLDWYRTHRIHRFEIAYVAEAHEGDLLSFYKETADNSTGNSFNVRIVKTSPDNPDPIEVCRSKVVFIAEH